MEEIKTDLFPGNLRAGKGKERKTEQAEGKKEKEYPQRNVVESIEPLPESSRPRKDGPGGE
ncbi:hypothetical protein AALA78_07290 [Lachnospiraceae bacterium 42-17]|jgi:hypothetical protein|nr:hypothetical protein [Dorea sp.]